MKKVLYLVLLTAISLTSCTDDKKSSTNSTTDKLSEEDPYSLIDTKYDSIVRKLKKLPQFKQAVFLSPKESREYLDIFIKNEEKFKTRKFYYGRFSTKEYTSIHVVEELKIAIDTTQSIVPLAEWERRLDVRQGKEVVTTKTNVKVYYLSKLKIIYLKTRIDGILFEGKEDFDETIRNNFEILQSAN